MRDPKTVQWTAKTFGELTKRLVNGGTPPTDVPTYWNGDIPWITGADFTQSGVGEFRRFVSLNAVRNTATNVIAQGELLIVTRTGVGKLAVTPCNVAISQDITGVYPDREQVDVEFLYHRMRQGVEDLKKLNQGTSINGIIRKDLVGYSIVLPPLPQQQCIAEILSTVDEAIEQTEALIAKTLQIKAGLMHDLFTRGVTPDGQLRSPREKAPHLYKESPLGWIPKEWDCDTAGTLAVSIVPGRNKPTLDGGKYPWITITDLQGSLVSRSREGLSVSAIALRNAAGRTIPTGAVIMSCVGEFGITAVAGCQLVINQQLHAFVPGDRIRPEWMMHALRMQKPFLERIATQTTINYLNKAGCESVRIPVPSMDEQDRILELLSMAENEVQSETTSLYKLKKLKTGLMHDLLTGRVRVKVPEPASA